MKISDAELSEQVLTAACKGAKKTRAMLAIVDNAGKASHLDEWKRRCCRECVCVFVCGVVLCAVKADEASDETKKKKRAYNHCQQIMSLSLCIEERVSQCWLQYTNMMHKSAAM